MTYQQFSDRPKQVALRTIIMTQQEKERRREGEKKRRREGGRREGEKEEYLGEGEEGEERMV